MLCLIAFGFLIGANAQVDGVCKSNNMSVFISAFIALIIFLGTQYLTASRENKRRLTDKTEAILNSATKLKTYRKELDFIKTEQENNHYDKYNYWIEDELKSKMTEENSKINSMIFLHFSNVITKIELDDLTSVFSEYLQYKKVPNTVLKYKIVQGTLGHNEPNYFEKLDGTVSKIENYSHKRIKLL